MNDNDKVFPYKIDAKNPPPERAAEGVLREWATHSANFPQFFYYGESIYAIWDKKDAEFFMNAIRRPGETDKEVLARAIGIPNE